MINWQEIDTVLLDMDGTLLDLQFDNFFWGEHLPLAYAEKYSLTEEQAQARLSKEIAEDEGTLQWYCLDHWSDRLGLDIAGLKQEISHRVRLRPHVEQFLSRLHESDRDLVMVTNAHRKTWEIKMNSVDISHWFDRIVISHDLEAAKEHVEFWQRLQVLHPFDPARTLLIDDTESVLASAQGYGIGHLLTLLQPDSNGQKRLRTHFPSIHHFDEIMPPVELQ